MCGLWGYVGRRNEARADVIREILKLASRRGPDAFGVWCDGALWRGAGRASFEMVDLGAAVMLGHARLATVLGTKRPEHGQPIQCADIVLAHNGSVWNSRELPEAANVTTGCDSELLAACLAAESGALPDRLARALSRVDLGEHYALAAYQAASGVLLAARGQSLYMLEDVSGVYWCSVRPDEHWTAVTRPEFHSLL
ncbi:asparagine synthetase B (glutamine-hydrolyzing) [Paraburkholderia sp. JPY465]|uniref:class II glutamine amidotransferase n=1 Tax=Paraburkholderia sp. JPY465 TaxID=3042285 RepID=UPI003D19CF1C